MCWRSRAIVLLPGGSADPDRLVGPARRAALEALGDKGGAHAEAVLLRALEGWNRDDWIVAAVAAGKLRMHAARGALERMSVYEPPSPNPDYVPESWAQDRVEREMNEAEAEEIRAAALEALRRLGPPGGR